MGLIAVLLDWIVFSVRGRSFFQPDLRQNARKHCPSMVPLGCGRWCRRVPGIGGKYSSTHQSGLHWCGSWMATHFSTPYRLAYSRQRGRRSTGSGGQLKMDLRKFFLGRGELKSPIEIIAAIRESPDFDPRKEDIADAEALLIFQTSKQQTWLVATRTRLYCVLDDLRRSFRPVRWSLGAERLTETGSSQSKSPNDPTLRGRDYWTSAKDEAGCIARSFSRTRASRTRSKT